MPPNGPRRPDPDRPQPRPEAPDKSAPKSEHKKYAEEFFLRREHKQKPPGYQDKNDEAMP